jgi:hypothetical protein
MSIENHNCKIECLTESSPIRLQLTYENFEELYFFKDGRIMTRTWSEVNGEDKLVYFFYKNNTRYNLKDWYYKGEIDTKTFKRKGSGVLRLATDDDEIDTYIGNFDDDYFEGRGIYTCADGRVYTGNFSADKMEGFGTFAFANGDALMGHFFEGKVMMDKVATFTFASESTFAGARPGDSVTSAPNGIMSEVVDLSQYDFTIQESEPEPEPESESEQQLDVAVDQTSSSSSAWNTHPILQGLGKKCKKCGWTNPNFTWISSDVRVRCENCMTIFAN